MSMPKLAPGLLSARPELVAIGASAGGFDALMLLLAALKPGFPFAAVALLHLPATHEGSLASVFGTRLGVPTFEAQARAPVGAGRVYFAPSGYHLLVEADRTFSLSCDPPVLFSRPSIDVLFESCADAYGTAAAAMLLTGANSDGGAGMARIKQAGALALVQDPAQAAYPAMPEAALAACTPDAVLPLEGLRDLLAHWSRPGEGALP
jgi:two-component system chemotaxis response regulator CheB